MDMEYDNFLGRYVPIRKSRVLKDIETTEVSLVDRPATGKRFLFFKRGDDNTIADDLEEKLAASDLSEEEQETFLRLLARITNSDELLESLGVQTVKKSADLWPSLSGLTGVTLLRGQPTNSDELDE